MRRRSRNQLVLDLDRGGRRLPAVPAPEELLNGVGRLASRSSRQAKQRDTGRARGV